MSLDFRFGTVGAPLSRPKKPGGTVGAVLHTRTLGLGAFEIGWVRSVRVSEKTCAAIKSAAQESDVWLSVHAPYYINLNADAEEWPKSRKRLMDAAHYGHRCVLNGGTHRHTLYKDMRLCIDSGASLFVINSLWCAFYAERGKSGLC